MALVPVWEINLGKFSVTPYLIDSVVLENCEKIPTKNNTFYDKNANGQYPWLHEERYVALDIVIAHAEKEIEKKNLEIDKIRFALRKNSSI